jgi:hypothetical protein
MSHKCKFNLWFNFIFITLLKYLYILNMYISIIYICVIIYNNFYKKYVLNYLIIVRLKKEALKDRDVHYK